MRRNFFQWIAASILIFGLIGAAKAAEHGEFNDMCAMGLAMRKQVPSDCTSRATYNKKTYCFGDQAAEVMFFQDPDANLMKAEAYWNEISKKNSPCA